MSIIPARVSSARLVVGSFAFLLGALQFFVAQVVTAAAWKSTYSWSGNWISDLGNTTCGQFAVPHGTPSYICSPLHAVMNASFVASGIFFLIGVVAFWTMWPRTRAARVGSALLLASGILKPLVGIFPENSTVSLHLLGALNLPLASLGILFISVSVRRVSRAVSVVGLVAAIVGLIGALLSTSSQYAGEALTLGLGYGGMERVADYPAFLWMVVVAVAVLGAVSERSKNGTVSPSRPTTVSTMHAAGRG